MFVRCILSCRSTASRGSPCHPEKRFRVPRGTPRSGAGTARPVVRHGAARRRPLRLPRFGGDWELQPVRMREGKPVRALRVRNRLTRGRLRAGHGGVRIIRNVSIGAREGFRGIGERTIHDSEDKVGDELVGSRARAL